MFSELSLKSYLKNNWQQIPLKWNFFDYHRWAGMSAIAEVEMLVRRPTLTWKVVVIGDALLNTNNGINVRRRL
jgi:hypothetical protein